MLLLKTTRYRIQQITSQGSCLLAVINQGVLFASKNFQDKLLKTS